ncbi:MAG: hypothetical protein CAF41_012530 [Nitrospira sp. CG24A]|nr:MAG: hypothetical protein CAF41_012530 [Nitrospira sp. CG24A]
MFLFRRAPAIHFVGQLPVLGIERLQAIGRLEAEAHGAEISIENDGRIRLEYDGGFGGPRRKERTHEAGTPSGNLCRQLGGSDATFYIWEKKYAHLGMSELRRLRQVEQENSRLKRLVDDLSLDKPRLS